MASVIYKKLFQVQILHEYFLLNSEETSVFDEMEKKDIFLQHMLQSGVPSISDSLSYVIPETILQLMKNHCLVLVPDYAGFTLMTKVKEQLLPDGTKVFKSASNLPADSNLVIKLMVKKPVLRVVTNSRITKKMPAVFYFTNQDLGAPKLYPVLSAAVPAFDPGYNYEQGELYTAADGKIVRYYADGNNPGALRLSGSGYASSADELIVPLIFSYRFNPDDHVVKAEFDLVDAEDNAVRSWSFQYQSIVRSQVLDVRPVPFPRTGIASRNVSTLPMSTSVEKNTYVLKVTINDSINDSHKLMFFDDGASFNDCIGIIDLKTSVADTVYNIYEDDGYLRYRILPDGTVQPPAVFELRMNSRISFWRYINDRREKLKSESGSPFLQRSGTKNLESKLPRAASLLPRMFTQRNNSGLAGESKYFPNPDSDQRIILEGGKVYSDILVPVSELFPLDNTS